MKNAAGYLKQQLRAQRWRKNGYLAEDDWILVWSIYAETAYPREAGSEQLVKEVQRQLTEWR